MRGGLRPGAQAAVETCSNRFYCICSCVSGQPCSLVFDRRGGWILPAFLTHLFTCGTLAIAALFAVRCVSYLRCGAGNGFSFR